MRFGKHSGNFAVELGNPSTREISRRASRAISHTTVQTVLRCDRLPRWGQLELVVGALQGNTDTFQRLWLQARDAEGSSLSVSSLETTDAQREAIAKAAKRARGFFSADGDMHDEMMNQVTADVRELASRYMRQPLPEILGPLVAAHDNVFSQLEQRQKPDHARELYFLSGVLGGILANASHDLADPHTAFSHARMAFLCAEQVNHNGLRAWIRGMQSLIAYRADQPHQAIDYAQQGSVFAERSGITSAVWLHASEARAWGKLGNASEAQAAIDRAEHAWDQVRPNDLDELGGICGTNRCEQLYYAADAFTSLPAEISIAGTAERYCNQAVEAYRDTSSPDWDFACQACSHADLAIVRIRRRDGDGADEALVPLLELPVEKRVNGVIQSAQHVQSLATYSPDTQKKLAVFIRTPLRAISY